MDTKLTVRVPRRILESAKHYAASQNITLTSLISNFLQSLPGEQQPMQDAPIVQRLSGVLSPDVSVEDYQKHLEEKYG
jgi:hypothetical protein